MASSEATPSDKQNTHPSYGESEGKYFPCVDLINPGKIRKFQNHNDRCSYEYVKWIALERLHQTLREQLDFLSTINHCEAYDLIKLENISHNVFSWSYEDFLARRRLENCVWVDVVMRKSSGRCLEMQKAKADLKEIQKFVDLVFKAGYELSKSGDNNLHDILWKPLREAELYNRLPESLAIEQKTLLADLEEVQARIVAKNVAEHLESQQSRLMAFEEIVMNSDVWDPIEVRYEINWHHSLVKQNQYQKVLIQSGYENEFEKLKMKTISEKQCGDSIMDTYYSVVEQYKRRINEFQERYDLEFEEMENKNNYIQAQIDKIRDTKKFHSQEIERFHLEIKKRLDKEERVRQEAELKRQEEEAAALALLEAQKLKKRKKVQDKRGPKSKMSKQK